ncbi:MAG: response regulator transcription factor [Verrucomicrobia bacterium]|nr:response regulator transcription factor [Leptolyngbya sp. ES-bin-22]
MMQTQSDRSPITDRQLEILQLAADGLSNREICQKLYIALGTTKTHFRGILERLEANDRGHAIAIGFRVGLLR